MAIMTSASANKMLKQLNEDKEYYTNLEKTSSTYNVIPGEDAIVPEYNYQEVANRISEIDTQIQKIKHAVNKSNVETELEVDGENLSVDTILVRMAQLNKRKETLDFMRKLPSVQVKSSGFGGDTNYQCINFDAETVRLDYQAVSDEITKLQIALDKHNQTDEFEVDII